MPKDAESTVGTQQSVGVKCQDCPYQDIWHAVRTERDVCKHDLVHDHDVEYVDPSEVRESVTMDGEVVVRHDSQQTLVTDGGEVEAEQYEADPCVKHRCARCHIVFDSVMNGSTCPDCGGASVCSIHEGGCT